MVSIIYRFVENDSQQTQSNQQQNQQNQEQNSNDKKKKPSKEQVMSEMMKDQDTPVKAPDDVNNADPNVLNKQIDQMIKTDPEKAKKIVERFLSTHDIRSVKGMARVMENVCAQQKRREYFEKRNALRKAGYFNKFAAGGAGTALSIGTYLSSAASAATASYMSGTDFSWNSFIIMVINMIVGSGIQQSSASPIIGMFGMQIYNLVSFGLGKGLVKLGVSPKWADLTIGEGPTAFRLPWLTVIGIGLICCAIIGILFKKFMKSETEAEKKTNEKIQQIKQNIQKNQQQQPNQQSALNPNSYSAQNRNVNQYIRSQQYVQQGTTPRMKESYLKNNTNTQQTKELIKLDICKSLYVESLRIQQSCLNLTEGFISNKLNNYGVKKLEEIKKINAAATKNSFIKRWICPILFVLTIGVLIFITYVAK